MRTLDLISHQEGPNPNRRRRPAPNFYNRSIVAGPPRAPSARLDGLNRFVDPAQPVHERRSRREHVFAGDLMDLAARNGRDPVPTRTRGNRGSIDGLAAP